MDSEVVEKNTHYTGERSQLLLLNTRYQWQNQIICKIELISSKIFSSKGLSRIACQDTEIRQIDPGPKIRVLSFNCWLDVRQKD